MNDKDLYKEIGQLLFNCTSVPEQKNHISIRIWPKESVDTCIWHGDYLSADTGYTLPPEEHKNLVKYIYDLHDYYVAHKLGDWNLAHFVLNENGSSFNIDFEYNEDIQSGRLHLFMYREKFKQPVEKEQQNNKSIKSLIRNLFVKR